MIAAGGVPALLGYASSSGGSNSILGSNTVAEQALAALMHLNEGNGSQLSQEWQAAMLAAGAVPILVQHLDGSCVSSKHAAAYMLADVCRENRQATAAAVQHGAAPLLVAAVRRPWDACIQKAVVFALCSLAQTTQVAGSLLQDGVAEALAHLLLTSTADEQAQRTGALTLGDLASGSEAHGLAVARRGGLRALVHLLQHGRLSGADAAVEALECMLADAPAVQAAAIAEGAIPALQAAVEVHPHSLETRRRAQHLRDLLTAAQQAQQAQEQRQHSAAGTPGSGSASSSGASQAAASAATAAPATPHRTSRRAPHVCSWCGVEAPAGVRFKKCAACQQVGCMLPSAAGVVVFGWYDCCSWFHVSAAPAFW